MNIEQATALAADLISFPSISGNESALGEYLEAYFETLNWSVEKLPVSDDRFNLFIKFGKPEIILTTHYDVVPGPQELFTAKINDGYLHGRGACDTKGIIASIVAAAVQLQSRGVTDFGILLVVGEEDGGDGAYAAAKQLKDRGIKYLVNGEPTEGKIITAHKGAVLFSAKFSGRACHSGYPELGDDANVKMLDALNKVRNIDLGYDDTLGEGYLNIGYISGGLTDNILSPSASARGIIRTVIDNSEEIISKLEECFTEAANVEIENGGPPAKMLSIPGFDISTAGYFTDIPRFAELGAKAVLYGPGTIHLAHTDEERIAISEMEEAIDGFQRIVTYLKAQSSKSNS